MNIEIKSPDVKENVRKNDGNSVFEFKGVFEKMKPTERREGEEIVC
jgi:hypothetical protein